MSRRPAAKPVVQPVADLPRQLCGDRITLRYPRSRDRTEFLTLKRASRSFLTPWEATPPDGTDPFSDIVFDRLLKTRRSSLNHRFLICLNDGKRRGQTGPVVGQISLSSIVRGSFQSCYVGYWIGKAHACRGYMTEALGLALAFAFEQLHLHRVEANIIPRNKPSLALVRKAGFRFEGTAKRYLRINGRWQDHEHWALTVDEWDKSAVRAVTRSPARSPVST